MCFRKVFISIFLLVFMIASCTDRDKTVDKSKLLGYDYRLYQDSPAWELAKAVEDQDVVKIRQEVSRNKSLLNYQEPRFGIGLLQMAIRTEKYRSVEILVQLGADPNLQDSYEGLSPLMQAAFIGDGILQVGRDTRYLELLLKYGGDPNLESHGGARAEGIDGNTPLSIACLQGSVSYVQILVKAGANINHKRHNTYDALYNALIHKYPDIVLYLLNHGAIYKQPLSIDYDNHKEYITDLMADWDFEKGSDRYKSQQKIVAFLQRSHSK
ncbi:ankyrin repeat domain-containing protein [Mucilaginibacter lappiensis]|uniref:ankyrin repeat domain-containing protein n=1 Tax=Mucilaginibacter lappiensis TaxID=354630 RepID=UPI003D1C4641